MVVKKLNLQRASLDDHRQVGKELLPPLQQIGPPMEQVFWLRDLLPEFLWIDALVQEYGRQVANRVLNDFLTEADQFNSHPKAILDGTIGAFRLIASEQREAFVKKMTSAIEMAVERPFAHILSLYPECPMCWMVCAEPIERSLAISRVREAVSRLTPGKRLLRWILSRVALESLFCP